MYKLCINYNKSRPYVINVKKRKIPFNLINLINVYF